MKKFKEIIVFCLAVFALVSLVSINTSIAQADGIGANCFDENFNPVSCETGLPITTESTTTTTLATCNLNVTNFNFLPLDPGATSGDGIKTTLNNDGSLDITSILISGLDWLKTGGGTGMDVGQTHWATNDFLAYNNMNILSGQGVGVLTTPLTSTNSLDTFFKLSIPNNQPAGDYTQQITFVFSCEGQPI